MSEVGASVKGLEEFNAKLEQIQRDIAGDPMRAAMAQATLLVTRSARQNAPVDRGPLRASIVPDIVMRDRTVRGIVGSNIEYAPYQEFGTRPFRPPWRVMYAWALRVTKGDQQEASRLAAGAILAISRRGIKPKKYLQRAIVDNAQRIYRIIGDAVRLIVSK